MTSKQAEQMLDGFLDSLVIALGFRRIKDQRFGRSEHDSTAQLSFPWRLSDHDTVLFTAWVGLRFESVAQWFDEGDDKSIMAQTTVIPIHLLHKDKYFSEWEFSNSNDLEKLRDTIFDDLKNHALPYIERYSRLADLRKALESPNKQDWFGTGLNVDNRFTVLAAIQVVDGDRAGAIKILDEGIKGLEETLAGRPHELRKRRFAMDYLRERLMRADKEK